MGKLNGKLWGVVLLISIIVNVCIVYGTEYTYDELGRLTEVTYGDDTEEGSGNVEYGYDSGGNITTVGGVTIKDKVWNMGSSGFKTLGLINSQRTIDGLTINATSSKDMEVKVSSKNLNGFSYTHLINLKGTGNRNERSLKFRVTPNSDVYIAAKSGGTENRTMVLANTNSVLQNVTVTENLEIYKYTYTGTADDMYIYSSNSAINIYYLAVDNGGTNTASIKKYWNFSDTSFSQLGMVQQVTNIDGLSIYKNCLFTADAASMNNNTYTRCLRFSGMGTNDDLSVSFDVSKNTDIFVTARADQSGRSLLVINKYGYVVDTIEVDIALATYHVNYSGSGERLYVRSQSSAIKVYGIGISTENENAGALNRTWNFGNSRFEQYTQSVTSNISLMDLTIKASTLQPVVVNETVRRNSERFFTASLSLGGSGNYNARNLSFAVPKNTQIKIWACTPDAGSIRTIVAVNQYGYVLGKMTLDGTSKKFTVTSTCDDEEIYIYSTSGNVYIQEVETGSGSALKEGYVEQRIDVESRQALTQNSGSGSMVQTTDYSLYKNQLNSVENAIYNQIKAKFVQASPNVGEVVSISIDNTDCIYNDDNTQMLRKQMKNAMSAFINDYPEVFWVNTFAYTFESSENQDGTFMITDVYMWVLRDNKYTSNTDVTNAISALNNSLSQIDTRYTAAANSNQFRFAEKNADRYDRVKFLYNEIRNVTLGESSTGNTAYEAISGGESCYDGITRAFILLCKRNNIPCIYARGNVQESNSITTGNSLCYVYMYDNWYLCDPARDILENNGENKYLLIADYSGLTKVNPSIYGGNSTNVGIFAYPSGQAHSYYVRGDANLDGIATAGDEAYIQQALMASTFFTNDRQWINSDMDGDGYLTANDLALLVTMISGKNVTVANLLEGITVEGSVLEAMDLNGDSIYDAEDMAISVNNLRSEKSGNNSKARSKAVNTNTVTKEDIIEVWLKG